MTTTEGNTMWKMLLAQVALLGVAGVGRAGDKEIVERLKAEGVGVGLSPYSVSVSLDAEHLDIALPELCELRRPLIVTLDHPGPSDAQLRQICDLPKLRKLSLCGCPITDGRLKIVARARGLEVLCLDGTAISDAGLWQLHVMQKLEFLHIRNCPNLTDAGVARLDKALPNCLIIR